MPTPVYIRQFERDLKRMRKRGQNLALNTKARGRRGMTFNRWPYFANQNEKRNATIQPRPCLWI